MDDVTRGAWAASVAVAVGGAWLLFAGGPSVQTLLVAIVAFAATFLALDLPPVTRAWRSRRRG
jgi:membrane protein implicated in regulation of membrane protease activity